MHTSPRTSGPSTSASSPWNSARIALLVVTASVALQGCGFLRSLTGREAAPEDATTAAATPAATASAPEAGASATPTSPTSASTAPPAPAFACKTCRTLAAAKAEPGAARAGDAAPEKSPESAAAEPVAVAAPVSVPAPVESAPVAQPAAKPAVPMAAAPLPAAPLPAAAPLPVAKEAAPAVLGSGYYINVGLFAIASNGTRAQKKLQDAQLPVLVDTVSSDKGMLTRVRVGPFATKAKANAAAKTIRGLKLEARVFKK